MGDIGKPTASKKNAHLFLKNDAFVQQLNYLGVGRAVDSSNDT